ncbi:amino acid ABC transporter permease [Blautia liquoris]|jgi:His/Glu/Gln/Arg/opine family amino acid ABC transporter permease subunit|uniref:Amino acid ABC transporter permease n=1 Tax=Blautia liquoris TaxID=2779518 RepID=A0A7M2RER9_9FIRM|nr:amino acid ABC transporter permease [Blautia liquoris]QOV18461.1 amino acid ABC transporter permease [Blautia liquoris]
MKLDFSSVWQYWPFLYHGALLTLKITLICTVLGFILGTLLSLLKLTKCKPLVWIANFYTSIFRGTPLLVQLCIIHFGIPQLIGITFTTTQSGILTFSLNSAAYVSEILRGGIVGVDKGQYEASMSLGVGYKDMMKDIIFPQAIRSILPGLVNEGISLLKESSILSYIGAVELLRAADQITVLTFRFFEPYLVIALIYYVMVMILTLFANRLERWLNRSDRVS